MNAVLGVTIGISLFFSAGALAEDEWSYSIGISVKQLSLDVYEKGKTDPEGVLTADYSFTPEVGIDSSVSYFDDSRWGYKYVMNVGYFSMTTQEVGLDDVDLNTSAKGYYFYAMPVAVYDFHDNEEGSSLLAGLGLGLGYLNASGSIILTKSSPQIMHNFDFSELTYSYGLFFEYLKTGWGYNVSIYGPEVKDGPYEYNLFDFGMTIRKYFAF